MSTVRVPFVGGHPVATHVVISVRRFVDIVAVYGREKLALSSISGAADVGGERAEPPEDMR
ncbi:hypothetical protein [Halobaculum rarum]|uniref:hypothetical protein n=1 Tax=Halobaculum rarum TaxID=3075122 RepID=UPI0032AF1E12